VEGEEKMKRNAGLLTMVFLFSFCSDVNPSLIDTLKPPIILITKNDSITEVKGAKGKTCILHTSDKIEYRIHFMKVGDTLEIE
jgi:hypothetical protein